MTKKKRYLHAGRPPLPENKRKSRVYISLPSAQLKLMEDRARYQWNMTLSNYIFHLFTEDVTDEERMNEDIRLFEAKIRHIAYHNYNEEQRDAIIAKFKEYESLTSEERLKALKEKHNELLTTQVQMEALKLGKAVP